jgi:hypothetical protein
MLHGGLKSVIHFTVKASKTSRPLASRFFLAPTPKIATRHPT